MVDKRRLKNAFSMTLLRDSFSGLKKKFHRDKTSDEEGNALLHEEEEGDVRADVSRPKLPYPKMPEFWPDVPWNPEPDTSAWDNLLRSLNIMKEYEKGTRQYDFRKLEWDRQQNNWPSIKPFRDEDEQQWKGVKILGQGGYGSATLYVKVDEAGETVDVSTTQTG